MSWTLTSNGVTQSLGEWGLVDVTRTRKSFACDVVTFRAAGLAIDANPLFAPWSTVSLADPYGDPWFVGIVTKIPLKGGARAEDQFYTISGPWWYFENLVFQQTWQIYNAESAGLTPTLRSTVIIGQATDGTPIDLGQMATTIMDYVLSTAAATAPPFIPFQIGTMTPDTIIPFSQVSDRTCAQILVDIFKWVPDVVVWFDYTTLQEGAPCPTLNFAQRTLATPVTLAYSAVDRVINEIALTPRADLVVPAVIVKYHQTQTIDGSVYSSITPDIYPVGAPDPAFRNLVMDVDLIGGSMTYLKQPLVTTDRPKDYNAASGSGALSSVTYAWLTGEHRAKFLRQYTIPAGSDPGAISANSPGNSTLNDITVNVDETKMTVLAVNTTLVGNATASLMLPSGTVAPGAGPGTATGGTGNALDYLGAELLEGTVPDWLTSDQNIFMARVLIEITLQYTGDDAVVQGWFGGQAPFTKKFSYPCPVTNGSTQTYSKLSNAVAPEAQPAGLAQNLYQGLSVLHYEGTIRTVAAECWGAVGLGNTLNLSGGRTEWTTMIAQVNEITEMLDTGTTTIRIGPPKHLSATELVDMLRATRERVQAYTLTERTDGKSTSAAPEVSGPGAAPAIGMNLPPSMTKVDPWTIFTQQTSGGWQCKVYLNSLLFGSGSNADQITVTGLDSWMTLSLSGNGDAIWLKCPVGSLNVASAMIGSIGNGNSGDFNPTIVDPWQSGSWVQNDGASPPNQTYFYVLLATVIADANGNPIVQQIRSKNLTVINRAIGNAGENWPAIFVEN